MTTEETLKKILNDLKNIGGIEALAVVRRDGLLLYSTSYYSGFVSTATDDDKSFFKACSSTTAIFLKCY